MFRIAFALMLGVLATAGALAADPAAALSAVSTAGEQRMLSQRIVKAYSQVGLDVMPSVATAQMNESAARFEANLAALKPIAAAAPDIQRAYDDLVAQWAPFRSAMAKAATRDAALALSRDSEKLLAAAERLTQAIEDSGARGTSRLVNLAGRQRMLSQRLAKAYMLNSWGVDSSALRAEMETASHEFSGGLNALLARPENTSEIRLELEEVALQWEWLHAAIAAEGAVSYRLVVAEAADSILVATDRVTGLYQQLGRR